MPDSPGSDFAGPDGPSGSEVNNRGVGVSMPTPRSPSGRVKEAIMTIGAALGVIVVGLVIAAFVSGAIGMIVAAVGVVGLILAVLSGSSARSAAL
jgi:hypothetical protein